MDMLINLANKVCEESGHIYELSLIILSSLWLQAR